jgi:hypothetical protein
MKQTPITDPAMSLMAVQKVRAPGTVIIKYVPKRHESNNAMPSTKATALTRNGSDMGLGSITIQQL